MFIHFIANDISLHSNYKISKWSLHPGEKDRDSQGFESPTSRSNAWCIRPKDHGALPCLHLWYSSSNYKSAKTKRRISKDFKNVLHFFGTPSFHFISFYFEICLFSNYWTSRHSILRRDQKLRDFEIADTNWCLCPQNLNRSVLPHFELEYSQV